MRAQALAFLPFLLLLLTPVRLVADAGDDQFAVAASHYANARWDLAVTEFQTLVQQFPSHQRVTPTFFYLGEALIQRKRLDEAQAHFEKFLLRDPEHLLAEQARYRVGEIALSQGRHEAARKSLEGFLNQHSQSSLAPYAVTYLAAATLALAERTEEEAKLRELAAEAEKLYHRALTEYQQQPLDVDCRFGLARANHLKGRFPQAIKAYEQVLDAGNHTITVQALYHLGCLHFDNDEFKKSEAFLARLLALAPETSWAKDCRAYYVICLANLNKWQAAEKSYDELLAQDGTKAVSPSLQERLANLALKGEQHALARRLFESLSRTEQPANRELGLSGLAWTLYESGEKDRAIEVFAKLLTAYPNGDQAAESAYLRAVLLDHADRNEEARTAYRLLADRYSDYKEAPQAIYRAAVLAAPHNPAEAVVLFRRLIDEHASRWPQMDDAKFRLAWALQDAGQTEEADKVFEEIHNEHRESRYWAQATYHQAERAAARNEIDKSRTLLEELVETKPSTEILAHALYLDARLAHTTEGWAGMQKPLERLIDSAPDSPLRVRAQFWLAEANYHLGHHQVASKLFDQLEPATDNEEWRPLISMRRAQLLATAKKWDEARLAAETHLRQFPEDPQVADVHYVLGRCLSAEARFDEARQAYLAAAPRDGSIKTETAAMAQWMIGETYMHQEQYDKAIQEFFRVEALYDFPRWQAASLLQAAKCYEHMDRRQTAASLYQQLLDKYPRTMFVQEATERLNGAAERLNGAADKTMQPSS